MNSTKFLLTLFLFFNLTSSFALTCSKNGTKILFINGVNVDEEEAIFTKQKLESNNYFDKTKLDSPATADLPSKVKFDYSYNTSTNIVFDVIEAMVQKAQLELGLPRFVTYTLVYQTLYNLPYIGQPLSVVQRVWSLVDPKVTVEGQIAALNLDTSGLKSKIIEILKKDEKTILFSHSQGNLFANSAYEELVSENPIVDPITGKRFDNYQGVLGNIQIASPAPASSLSKSTNVTNEEDFITFVPNSWSGPYTPFNTDGEVDQREWLDRVILDHYLLETYLADYDKSKINDPFDILRKAVIQKTYDVATKLESNCGIPPVANFEATSHAYAQTNPDPMTYDFDGSISTDEDMQDPTNPNPVPEPPDFDIVSFEWLIDGTITLSGMNPTFAFTTEGVHSVQLIVTDLEGNKSEPKILPVTVVNEAPVPNFQTEVLGMKIKFNALASTDDGMITNYAWDFGDGFVGNGVLEEHTYLLPGTYLVTLVVTDNNGKTSTMVQNVTTFNQPPIADFTFSKNELVVNFNAAASSDPDGQIVAYIWSFGDLGNAGGVSPSHTYAEGGTYQVTLTVVDNFGSFSSVTKEVELSDQAFGCLAYGPAQPGKIIKNFNPIGGGIEGTGAFVADTAFVASYVILNGGEICGNSFITAAPNNITSISNSSINNSNITTGGPLSISDSTINSSTVSSAISTINIASSTVNASLIAGIFIDVTNSTINASVTATNFIGMQNSTINEPLTGDNIIVINDVRF